MANVYIIRAFARPCSTLLYLQIGETTGKTRFIAKRLKTRQVETIDLSSVAGEEILAEIKAKSNWNVRYGHALQTVMVTPETKEFINGCWDELKALRPQLGIK